MGEIFKIQRLYQSGLSQADVAAKLSYSVGKVVYLMNKHGIKKRNRSDATYLKRNPAGDPFKIKEKLKSSDYFLYGLGLGLFLGEGNKKDKNSVRLGNSDPCLVKKFIEFLIIICGIKRKKLRFGLQIFTDSNPSKVLKYWQEKINFGQEYFLKPIITEGRGKGSYKEKTKTGVLTVYFHNKKLHDFIISSIQKL